MTYFIDTDVMIDFFKHKDPAKELITQLSRQGTLALSALTVTELRSGWTSEQADYLLPRLYALCSIVPVSKDIAEQTGKWRQQYKGKGMSLGTPDTVIAATACKSRASFKTGPDNNAPNARALHQHCKAADTEPSRQIKTNVRAEASSDSRVNQAVRKSYPQSSFAPKLCTAEEF